MKSRLVFSVLAVLSFILTACNYDAPLTAQPTHPINDRLLGEWVTQDGDKTEHLLVRRLDENVYVLASEGELYRAFHSDFAGQPFISVQSLQPGEGDRKYTYLVWKLSADGSTLALRAVNPKLIPPQAAATEGMQKLVEKNIHDPALFGDELVYRRPDAVKP